jgi:amylosucrase
VREAEQGKGPVANLLAGVKHIMARRKATPQLSAHAPTRVIDVGNAKVFAFLRLADDGPLAALFNMTEQWTSISASRLRAEGITDFADELGGGIAAITGDELALAPYARMWLV